MSDRHVFTTSTTVTVSQYLKNVKVFLIGGGSSGKGSHYGGGGAGYITTATYPYNLTPGQTVTVTIGAGGAATPAENSSTANAGGTTTINISGTEYSAAGGDGGGLEGGNGSSGGGGAGNHGVGGTGGSGGSNGLAGASYSAGTGMGTTAFNDAISFMSGYNIYNIRAGAGGAASVLMTNQGGGGGGGVITGSTDYPLDYPTAGWAHTPPSSGAKGYGAGGGSGGWTWAGGLYNSGGAGAPGLVYMWADTIPAVSPTLTFNNMNATYGNGAFIITRPTTNSGGSFTYTVIDGTSVSISGTTVTILDVGTTTVRASQAASGNFLAGSVDGTISVSKVTPTLTFNNMTATYGNGAFGISQPSTDSGGSFTYTVIDGTSVSISGTNVTILSAGTTTVRASQAESGNFLAGSVDGTIVVSKATPSLNVSKNRYITKYILNGTINFDVFSTDAESGFTRQYSSNNSGIISIPNSASPSATIAGSGKTTINVTQNTTTNYNAVTINQVITFIIVGPSDTYSSEDMTSLDLSETNLSGSTFSSCNLTSANLTNANLTNSVFSGSTNLTSADLYNATVNSSTNLSSSTITSIKSGRITGVTTLLPSNYIMI